MATGAAQRLPGLPGGLVVVTGATGFLGGHLVRALLERDVPVRALGRNLAAGLLLQRLGAEYRPVDLCDRPAMIAACAGARAVVHAGALSSAWGRRQDFYATNVEGTGNVVAGCVEHGVERLVHISSPSVLSRHQPQLNLNERHPFPSRFVSLYSETKAAGEKVVHEAIAAGLDAVILRPKAIYGPGDRALFPRLAEALSKGRLPILGSGETITNITHVQDVVQAILRALAVPEARGQTYLITGDEEVNLWEVVRYLAQWLDHPAPSRRITARRAMAVAAVLELLWRVLRLPGEPPLTRYKVSILSYSQTYNIRKARTELGYRPTWTWQKGISSFLEGHRDGASAKPDRPEPGGRKGGTEVSVTVLNGGITRAPARLFGASANWRKVPIPALFALIRHPQYGPVVFDTGYSTRFHEATREWPYRLFRLATPVTICRAEDAGPQLQARGIDPATVSTVVVSHFDPDHIGGLSDFPNAQVIASARSWGFVAGKRGFAAMHARLLPGLLPEGLTARLHLLPDPAGPGWGPFARGHDLFGDGSVLLVLLDGHAPGQLGALVRTDGGYMLLAADGCWATRQLTRDPRHTGIHYRLASDKAAQQRTYDALRIVLDNHPEVTLVPAHCPEAAGRLGISFGDRREGGGRT